MDTTPRITATSWLMIATLGIIWGGTFMVTEIALTALPPFWVAAARVGLASLVMVVIWTLRGRPLFYAAPDRSQVVALVSVGALSGAVPFAFLAWGQQHVTSGYAGVSMASTALILLPLAHFLVPGERMTLRRLAGFLIGFAGVAVLIGGQALAHTGSTLETAGRLACLGAASCYALSSILMRRLPPVDPIGLATVLLLIGTCLSVPLALAVDGWPPAIGSAYMLGVIAFLGIVPTAAANFLRVLVVRSAGPVFMSLVNYQVPLWSVLLGAALLGEPLPPSLLQAMALILAGLALSQYGALRRLFARP
ncbi:EamA family transporter [Sulfitobacter alexandrii]|uniref:EamA family transporter n=1 Tax=Sulfitobacter alexandrii TaxID=1917485 RepID=A0A1J0WFC5_9RHOB|nr:DMT family transporter [Sulfitobacter alexandrii]APE43023.1 EamA family transporter [Sulfitobacter alexandrii]